MNNILPILLASTAGFALGVLFFGGLWFTVQKSVRSKQPALWFMGSFVLRTAIVLTGFYFMAKGSWQNLLACVAGFIIARLVVIAFTKRFKQTMAGAPKNQL